jgi:hypothetical protein
VLAQCERRLAASSAVLRVGNPGVGCIDAQSRRQRNQMILFLHEDATQTFRDGEFVQFIGLFDPAAIVADRLFLILQIELEYVFRFLRGLDRLRCYLDPA